MNQKERRQYLIRTLLDEEAYNRGMKIPDAEDQQKLLLRGLMNLRAPKTVWKASRSAASPPGSFISRTKRPRGSP